MDRIVRKAILTVINWMWDQMYGLPPTVWSYGDRKDSMSDAYDLLKSIFEGDEKNDEIIR